MSGSLSLTGYYITEQSWLILFNVGSLDHLRLAGHQHTVKVPMPARGFESSDWSIL